MMEFHISRRAREKYHLDDSLFSYDGNTIIANFHAARTFAHQINSQLDLLAFPEQAIKAGQINAIGLIDEIFHHIFSLFRQQKSPAVLSDAVNYLEQMIGERELNIFLEKFIFFYPPTPVFSRKLDPSRYLSESTGGIPNRQLVIEELLMLWLSLENPALISYSELFVEENLTHDPRFSPVIQSLQTFFANQPPFGPDNKSLLQMLQTPSIEVPHSITGQLEYIRVHWSSLLGEYIYRLLSSLDLLNEENKLSFTGPGPVSIPVYDQKEWQGAGGKEGEPEAFSKDHEWMPRLVLIAKNTYVWLDQLSQKYQKPITRLDQIPDAELETLKRWGITGLWLIGLWERSPASAQIKRLCGNPDAISSAYSLYSYQIASDLGGEAAYQVLRDAAARHGIRLASDMVPNHMGIDSEWVIHHPNRFLSLEHCPFPSYTFNGQDLSSDPSVTIQIEDHYYDRSDAAVVFRRRDNHSGMVKYIYHGNDGTAMPWNDTAQLNYLNPEVRESVIQTILEVARKFPIIRFDAAMTLAKKHYQRLWFPQPGTGGAIPSRSEYGLTQEEFDRVMPVEFWREVVDRVAAEAPGTLLLAEAFWLMEGYFVRSLGMHRVYNSAFMNMLRNEDNAGYRKLIKNTMEFEPEILKRYVNFMNNPDERTAVEQFGKGDKYFGTCVLMVTMPGLPMLGHGQIEGFSEKYGMEFHRAYWNESADPELIARHEREIFPLLHQRELFAEVDNFNLFDFYTLDGNVNENIYAYTNYNKGKSALVVYNNNLNETEGWIQYSVPRKQETKSEKTQNQLAVDAALRLPKNRSAFITFRDQVTGCYYLRPLSEILDRGFHFKLRGYEYHVFLDFQVVIPDALHNYSDLYSVIGEQGVPDIEQSLKELFLNPIVEPFRQFINYGYLHYLRTKYSKEIRIDSIDSDEITSKVAAFLNGITLQVPDKKAQSSVQQEITNLIFSILGFPGILKQLQVLSSKKMNKFAAFLSDRFLSSESHWMTLMTWAVAHKIGNLTGEENHTDLTISLLKEWRLKRYLEDALRQSGCKEAEIQDLLLALDIGIAQQNWYKNFKPGSFQATLQKWFSEPEIQYFLKINRYNEILWFNREAFTDFTWWVSILPMIQLASKEEAGATDLFETALHLFDFITALEEIVKESSYQVEKLITLSGNVKV